MPRPLPNRIAAEFVPGKGIHYPDTGYRGRGLMPSYGDSSLTVTHMEPVTISLPIGSIAANGSTTISGQQNLTLSDLALAATDSGQVLFGNISVNAPANVIVSAPRLYIATNQGTPSGGVLSAGQAYSGLALKATALCSSIAGSSAGTVTISASVLVLGTQTG